MFFMRLVQIALFWGLVFWANPVFATQTLDVGQKVAEVDLAPHLELFEDPQRQYGAEDLRTADFNARFEALMRNSSSYGFSNSDWWVRFKVRNAHLGKQELTFGLDYPLLDHVDVWVFSGETMKNTWETGNRCVFSSRAMEHREFRFPLTLAPREEQTIYIRVRTKGPVNISLSLSDTEENLPKIQLEYLAFGVYFGGFLLLALCVSLLYLIDSQIAFLHYLAYIISYAGYMLAFNGLASQYLWPDAPAIGQIARPILLTLSTFFLLQFSRSLLEIGRISPFLFKSTSALQAVLVAMLLATPFLGYGVLVMPFATLLLLALILVLTMGVVAHRSGKIAARYYLMAWSVFIGGLLLYLLKVFGLLPHNFVTHYGFQIGSFFEFIFLSGALVVRVRELRVQSHVDGLTGLDNRRSFDKHLAEEFALSTRPESELSLLVVDVDHFKKFNDKYGHAIGDRVLKELGQVFKKQIRRPGHAFRYGGEEFAVLLPRTGLEEALVLGQRLRKHVQTDLPFDNVTISVGAVSLKGGGFVDTAEFFHAGDKALYQAKQEGRNRVAFYREAHGEISKTVEGENAALNEGTS